jgi:hypothetical protein
MIYQGAFRHSCPRLATSGIPTLGYPPRGEMGRSIFVNRARRLHDMGEHPGERSSN